MSNKYAYSHAPITFYFKQSSDDFVVTEQPLYSASDCGEHQMMFIRKKGLSTHEMQAILAKECGCKPIDIGVAGLKDKHSLSYQYVTLQKSWHEKLIHFTHPNIKILSSKPHKNKLKMGHLKGNSFFIRLKKVTPVAAKMIDEVLKQIQTYGMPNYFGYQRFGNDGQNYLSGEALSKGVLHEKNKTKRRFLINAYQSHLFNAWLSRRIEISHLIESFQPHEIAPTLNLDAALVKRLKTQKHPFKVLPGDVMMHYPFGKLFHVDSLDDANRLFQKDSVPTGALFGKKMTRAEDEAAIIESSFFQEVKADGARRYAWVFPTELQGTYKEQEHWYELSFTLPKGSYATTLLEEIAKRPLKEEHETPN